MKPSIKEFTKIEGSITSYPRNGIEANAQIRVEHDADLFLNNPKLNLFGRIPDDVPLTKTDDLSTTKQMRIALSSKMVCYSGTNTEKLVASNSNKLHTKAISQWSTTEPAQKIWKTPWFYQDKNCF